MNGIKPITRSLMICNYINTLPRCQEESYGVAGLQAEQGPIARQTHQHLRLEVGQLGYLSSQYSRGTSTSSTTLVILVASILCSIHL